MPFIVRKIEPRYIGRGHVPQDTTCAEVWPVGAELGAITNGVLACTLKQLASLLNNAEDIFSGLTAQLTHVADRSGTLRRRIDQLDDRLATIDPKKIPVPESDISTFATRKKHFVSSQVPTTRLFDTATRSKALNELYDAAAIIAVKNLDSIRRERDGSAVDMYICTPILGKRRRDKSFDIESRVPAILDDLRRWTSTEALGDVTVAPDCMSRIFQGINSTDDAVDHKLPSPEERVQTIALKFPAEIVAVDVSGRGFARMSMRRRSLAACQSNQLKAEHADPGVVKRRSRVRKSRGKRRNTIAGTDPKEIKRAITEEESSTVDQSQSVINSCGTHDTNLSYRAAYRSASIDILGDKKETSIEIKWNFESLKAWGKSRLKRNNNNNNNNNNPKSDTVVVERTGLNEINVGNCNNKLLTENGYEHCKNKKDEDEMRNERKPSLSSLSGRSVASSIILSTHTSSRQSGVRLRESAAQRRERRKGSSNNRDDPPHSSSGNWSASSESGRASIGSETTTTNPLRSVPSTCVGMTKMMSQSQAKRFKARDTSTSSSVTSEGTLTPDIIHDIATIPFSSDAEGEGETCSIYSCDTEGYYTSFHMDSGLKTLREEELLNLSQHNTMGKMNDTINYDVTSPIVENEYELYGRGSTSTTTSSAGTVCTALMAPAPPERKSSLTVVAMVHGQNTSGGESPDSGHNTSSSPVESASSPACCTARSCSELEYSESSDLEGCDRIERIRSKTAISTSRIPSMCVITPSGSDDEQQQQQQQQQQQNTNDDLTAGAQILMSATVGTSKMEVINGQDQNLYATVQTVEPMVKKVDDNLINSTSNRTTTLGGVLEKIRCVLPLTGRKNAAKNPNNTQATCHIDSGDYVTIADVRNNNDKCRSDNADDVAYANAHLVVQQSRDSDYVSLSELPKKNDSSLERKRQGARVTLDSEGKVIYSSDSLKRRKGAHTTFNPGPFVRDSLPLSPAHTVSPKFHRRPQAQVRAISIRQKLNSPTTSPVRQNSSPESNDEQTYDTTTSRPIRGAYVNIQSEEGNTLLALSSEATMRTQMSPNREKQRQYHRNLPKIVDKETAKYFDNTTTDTEKYKENNNMKNIFSSQKYNTMPHNNCRSPKEFAGESLPVRSVTPDLTRQLDDNNTKHWNTNNSMETQISRKSRIDMKSTGHDVMDSNRQILTPSNTQNRYFSPRAIPALGYHFFASTPVHQKNEKSRSIERLNHSPITTIPVQTVYDCKNYETTTPICRCNMTLGKCMCSSSRVSGNYHHVAQHNWVETPVTPENILLPVKKSTMSNDELFAAIYKSKRKLNIKNDTPDTSVLSTNTINDYDKSASLHRAGSRHSWSPESQNIPESAPIGSVNTARLDFKRLLLQQSTKIGPNKLSAAEQLKLSRQQQSSSSQVSAVPQRNQKQTIQQQNIPSIVRALSPRSPWRFQTPRSDVLSSTIIEDTAAEEKAMKPSPENYYHPTTTTTTTTTNRTNTKRQLDLSGIISPSQKKMINDMDVIPSYYRSDPNLQSVAMRKRQLKADFFANPTSTARSIKSNYQIRSRSESPRDNSNFKTVSPSPSAPTLETAL